MGSNKLLKIVLLLLVIVTFLHLLSSYKKYSSFSDGSTFDFSQKTPINLLTESIRYPDFNFKKDLELVYCPFNFPKEKCNFNFVNEEFRRRVIVVNFWASWCKPCIEEIPSLVELSKKFDTSMQNLVFISVDDDLEQAKKALLSSNPLLNAFLFWDKNKIVSKTYGVEKYPETFFLTKNLLVVSKINGAIDWLRPDVFDFILSLNNL